MEPGGERRIVELVDVVDEQYESVLACLTAQLGTCGVEQSGPFVLADAKIVHEPTGQEVRHRAKRDGLRRGMADGACRWPCSAFGETKRLLGETRLADARGPRQDDTAGEAVEVVTAELLELSRASSQGPRREGHIADDTTRDDSGRS